MPSDYQAWWKRKEGEKHLGVFEYVSEVERTQIDIFERFVKLEALYDPNSYQANLVDSRGNGSQALLQENVIASNVDTVHSAIAAAEVRARFMTDDGDWSTQRLARHLEWYADGVTKQIEVPRKVRRAFKDSALKGTGLVKVFADRWNRIRAERVMVDDIIVDEAESRASAPTQMHQRLFVDAEQLKAEYAGHDAAIDAAVGHGLGGTRFWATYRPIQRNEVVCIESWKLPYGEPGEEGYVPGCHTVTIDGEDLFEEEWEKPFFPFARIVWSERTSGWYGISLAERIAGHQRVINKTHWQIDRQLDQHAVPTTYVRVADANIAVKSRGPLGTMATYKSDVPVTVIPPAVSGETYRRLDAAKSGSYEESGVSRMAAQATKPAGLDSGVALREYRDQTTQRFSQQEKAYEQLYLDTVLLILDCAKDLGADAPTVIRKSKWGPRTIKWSDVDMGEAKVQIAAAANLSKTPAGRVQYAMELAQAGVISQDEARRAIQHPDMDSILSLYTAAQEDVERCVEEIFDGAVLAPEPYQNVKMIVWRGQMHYLKARGDGAPEDILENLRQFIVQAAWIDGQTEAPQDMTTIGAEGGADSTMPPTDPALAGAVAGGPMADMAGPAMTGAGVMPADLLQ